MFSSRKRPSTRLSAARSRSPCSTTMSTAGWLSSAVENTSVRRAGIVVFRSMILVITPPRVSTPSDSGVTSSRRTPNERLDGRDTGRAPDEDDFVDVVLGDLPVRHGLLDGSEAALDEIPCEAV